MTISNLYPTSRPSLSLNFARVKALDPRITFTRASAATYYDADGVLRFGGNNQARFDHDPVTGESLGLLIEEQRTNEVSNPAFEGAAVGVIDSGGSVPTTITFGGGGLTREITAIGIEDGIPYVDIRRFGVATSSNFRDAFMPNIAITQDVTYTSSFYATLVAGSPSDIIQHRMVFPDEIGPSFSLSSGPLKLNRFVRSRTAASTTTGRMEIRYSLTIGDSYDFTVRYGAPQFEVGSFPTSPIFPPVGTVAQSTRLADNALISGTNFSSWYNQDQGTVFVDASAQWIYPVNAELVWLSANSSSDNRIRLWLRTTTSITSNRLSLYTTRAGVNGPAILNFGIPDQGTRNAIAFAYTQDQLFGSKNGLTVLASPQGALPKTLNRLHIGSRTGAAIGGHIRKISYYPTRIADSQLQALTR
jgi:hypothetical protein